VGANGFASQGRAPFGDDHVEFGQGLEMPVGDWLIDQGPQAFGGLEFWAVWRQKDEDDALRNGQAGWAVPSGVVENQDDDAVVAGADFLGEGVENGFEQRLVDGIDEVPHGFASGRFDESDEVQPLEAVMAEGDGALAHRRPDPAMDRLQPEAVLVGGPDLDRLVGVTVTRLGDRRIDVFLSVSCSSAPAARGWRGRGTWIDHSILFKASQPR
jgi:hypothetical protein